MAERDASGKFQKGNSANTKAGKTSVGSGRKPDVARRALHDLMDEAVSDADWIAIFRSQRELAIQGDVKAAQYLSDRKFGKPKDSVEITDSRENVAPTSVVFNAPSVTTPACQNSSK